MYDSLDKNYLIKYRRLTIFKIIMIIIIPIVISILLMYFLNTFLKDISVIFKYALYAVILVLFIIAILFIVSIRKKYIIQFKNIVIPILARDYIANVYYSREGKITKEIINELEMMNTGNECTSEHYLRGGYKNNLVELENLLLADNTSFEQDHQRKVLLNGKIYYITLKYGFVDDVFIADKYSNLLNISNTARISTKDETFDNRLRVFSYTSSQILTFLTEEKRKLFLDFLDNIKCDVAFYFHKDKLYIAINGGKTSINVPLFSKFNIEEYQKEMFNQLDAVIKFVDSLGLFVE